jgi:hypothetical protein
MAPAVTFLTAPCQWQRAPPLYSPFPMARAVIYRSFVSAAGERWQVSLATTPVAPAARAADAASPETVRTRLYFWSAAGVMRSVLHPGDRRMTDADLAAISDEALAELVAAPDATEMGRLSVLGRAG